VAFLFGVVGTVGFAVFGREIRTGPSVESAD